MGQIIYQITSGTPDFQATLSPGFFQSHSQTGVYSFDDVPEGNYIFTLTDSIGCRYTKNISIAENHCVLEGTLVSPTTTSTTTLSCAMEGTAALLTTTTTTFPPTTTTTTLPPTTTTTTTVDCGTVVEILSIDLQPLTTTTTIL